MTDFLSNIRKAQETALKLVSTWANLGDQTCQKLLYGVASQMVAYLNVLETLAEHPDGPWRQSIVQGARNQALHIATIFDDACGQAPLQDLPWKIVRILDAELDAKEDSDAITTDAISLVQNLEEIMSQVCEQIEALEEIWKTKGYTDNGIGINPWSAHEVDYYVTRLSLYDTAEDLASRIEQIKNRILEIKSESLDINDV